MKNTQQNLRPPIVAVLGHVDHGKTTLLDAIRKTRVQIKEVGGITQSIGATQVETKEGKKVTFIDTPGHAAFKKMRSSGATAADIAVLVVASDDGVKPQTIEAIEHINEAKLPMIVVFTKIDLPTSSTETVLNQLEKHNLYFEGRGGNIPYVEVSSKTKKGIDDLLEMITLLSDVNGIGETNSQKLEAIVIETKKSRGGPLVSVVIRSGNISVQQEVYSCFESIKVKGIFNSWGKPVRVANPGDPVMILGFSKLPSIGSIIVDDQSMLSDYPALNNEKIKVKGTKDKILVIIKAGTTCGLDAVMQNIPEGIIVIDSGIGDVNESDVMMAKNTNSRIFVFESGVGHSVKKLAETDNVEIEVYDLIYKLLERFLEMIDNNTVKTVAKAKVIAEFPYNNKRVAGCSIIEGEINNGDELDLMRNDVLVGEMKVISLKKAKQDVIKVRQGEECGMIFRPQLDFSIGDMLLSVRK